MIICNWNIRGLNKAYKHTEIRKFISDNDIQVMGLTETRVKAHKQDFIHKAIMPQWNLFTNNHIDSSSRIWVLWNPNRVNVDILLSNHQMIHVRVTSDDHKISFQASFIYAYNTGLLRVPLWNSN